MAGETSELVGFAAGLRDGAPPSEVMERAKALVLDTIGVMYGARRFIPSNRILLQGLREVGTAGGIATVLGEPGGWSPLAAAMANASLAHGMDFDDTHLIGLHPTAVLFPAAAAAAEMVGADGETVLKGLVAGYEVMCRIGQAIIPAGHYGRGFHPTATTGVFGAAAAAGVVLGLTTEQMDCAFGLCGSQAAGASQFLVAGGWNKHFHIGAAAANGLLSATLAKKGYLGAAQALEGSRGFLQGYGDGADPSRLTRDLGTGWETLRIGVKPYPCCRYSHSTLDGLVELVRSQCIDPAAVSAVRLGICTEGVRAVGEPDVVKRHPKDVVGAQFSLHYVAAIALLKGRLRWEDYELLDDFDVRTLCDKIDVHVSSRADQNHPAKLSSDIEVEAAGTVHRLFRDTPAGEPETFPALDGLLEKFLALTEAALGRTGAERLAHAILCADQETQFRNIMRDLRAA